MKYKKVLVPVLVIALIMTSGSLSVFADTNKANEIKAPKTFTAKAKKAKQIKISWSKVSGAKGYVLYKKSGKKYKKIKTLKKTGYIDKKIKKNKVYAYKVKAYKISNGKKVYSKNSFPITAVGKSGKKVNASKITLNKKSVTLTKGQNVTLKAKITPKKKLVSKNVKWSSSNKKVATVSKGKVKAVGKGTCTITARTHNGKTVKCKITVKEPAKTPESKDLSMTKDVSKILKNVDMKYAEDVMKTLAFDEKYFDGPAGFRTAGSDAEKRAAKYLEGVWRDIGLTDIEKVAVDTDKWQFNDASFKMTDKDNNVNIKIDEMDIVSYASSGSDITAEVVYMKQGYKSDYEAYYNEMGLTGDERNMDGKIVLIDINQNTEYWITPHYTEAYDQGAAGLISYSSQYTSGGGKWNDAVQIQDLCAPDYEINCVSISRSNGKKIKSAIEKINLSGGTPEAALNVDNEVSSGGTSYNVIGKIKGTGNTGQQLLVAGHYDKYFYGLNDDCAAIGQVAGIAKAMVDSGFKPYNDIIFIAHGAEEWGRMGVEADWAQGSWEMITQAKPEWKDTTIGLLNFELPAMRAADSKLSATMDSVEESAKIIEKFLNNSKLTNLLSKKAPVKTRQLSQPMSDAICYQFNGVPCYQINAEGGAKSTDLSSYHTQFDDEDDYSAEAMQWVLEDSCALLTYLDGTPAQEYDYSLRCEEFKNAAEGNEALYEEAGITMDDYNKAVNALKTASDKYLKAAETINDEYEKAYKNNASESQLDRIRSAGIELNKKSLKIYKLMNDSFLAMSGGDVNLYHEVAQTNINILDTLTGALTKGDIGTFMDNAWQLNGMIEYGAYSFGDFANEEAIPACFPAYHDKGVTDNRLASKGTKPVISYETTVQIAQPIIAGAPPSDDYSQEVNIYSEQRSIQLAELSKYLKKEIKALNKISNMLSDIPVTISADGVMCENGNMIGLLEDGVSSYRGIPYAKAPVGELRWQKPTVPAISTDDVDCTDFGKMAMQDDHYIEASGDTPKSEDCLNLNIWTTSPNNEDAEKPVMVFIHGGGWGWGGTCFDLYDGKNFVEEHDDVILVTLNYRLGMMGFIDFDISGAAIVQDGDEYNAEDFGNSPHLGLYDQIQALKWIQANIENFGGDPDNVTIFGESAGGASTSLLMIMDEAEGLFNRCISQSGSVGLTDSEEAFKPQTELIVKAVADMKGKDKANVTMDDLMALSEDDIKQILVATDSDDPNPYSPSVNLLCNMPQRDGEVLPLELEGDDGIYGEFAKSQENKGVDFLVGSTKNEWNYWISEMGVPTDIPNYQDISFDAFKGWMNGRFAEDKATKIENSSYPGYEAGDIGKLNDFMNLQSGKKGIWKTVEFYNDIAFRVPAIKQAEGYSDNKAANNAKTYMYYWEKPSTIDNYGACHAVENAYLFNNLHETTFCGPDPDPKLAKKVQEAWINFAKTGNPSIKGTEWPEYDSADQKTMSIDNEWKVLEYGSNDLAPKYKLLKQQEELIKPLIKYDIK